MLLYTIPWNSFKYLLKQKLKYFNILDMESESSKLAIALNESNKCHNDKYIERLINSPALQYDKSLNYIYIKLPRGEEHLVDRKCVDEYYSWLSEYLKDEINNLDIERETITTGIEHGSLSKDQVNVFTRILTDPSEEQMKNMIGYNVRKDEGLLLKGRLVVALEKELNGVETQERSNLIDNINMIYQKKIDKLGDLIVKYENTLMELGKKINDVEANKRMFNLQESNNKSKKKQRKKKTRGRKGRKGRKKSKKNNNNNNNN